jgi:predicted small metal-binding protein
MDIDKESMEILLRYAREVHAETTINNAEHENISLRISPLASIG